MKIIDKILNLLFPPHCILCDGVMDFRSENLLCDKCQDLPTASGNRCYLCYRSTRGYYGTDLCHLCRQETPYYTRLRAVYEHQGYARDCVLRLKFHSRCDHAPTMAAMMTEYITGDEDVIIPVPISKNRLKERGYNQSELMANKISELVHIPTDATSLIKIKDNQPQSTVQFNQRAENVRGVYKVTDHTAIMGKDIILIDDVATTRSTLNECARVLKKAGAKRVYCITFTVAKYDE